MYDHRLWVSLVEQSEEEWCVTSLDKVCWMKSIESWKSTESCVGDLAMRENLGDPGGEGLTADEAKLRFVRAYGKAMAEDRDKTNFRAY